MLSLLATPALAQTQTIPSITKQDSIFARPGVQSSLGLGRIQVEVARDELPADGQTPAQIKIQLVDASGQPLTQDTEVTFEASGGVFQIPGANSDEAGMVPQDLDAVTPGLQVLAKGGVATVWLRAPIDAQTVDLKVSSGALSADGKIHFIPALRDMVAAGLVDGVISVDRKNPLLLGQARPDDGFEDTINSWSRQSSDGKRNAALRTAFFLKGKVKGNALLTMAYDSDKPDRDRLFRDLDPEHWYPVYGDASIVGFDAQSSSRLYVRLDKGRNYLLYGDIVTGDGFSQRRGQGDVASTAVRDLGQYNRAMTGVRGHLENTRGALDVFGAYDSLRQVVEEFPGRGLSGPYTVSNSAHAVLGSERVELVTRDRYAPSRLVEVKQLGRFTDYSFEPFSGRIIFNAPIPSVDALLNPVSVRITYEVDQGGEKYWVYGANGQYQLTQAVEVGGSAVKDENPLAPYELASVNATWRMSPTTWLRGEYARTTSLSGAIGGNIYTMTPAADATELSGDAWRMEFGHRGKRTELFAWYGESDRDFNNPASSYLGGRRQAGLSGLWWLGSTDAKRWSLFTQSNWIRDEISEAERSQAQVGVRFRPNDKFSLDIGANHIDEHAGNSYGNGLTIPGQLSAPYGVGVVSPGFGGGFFGGSANALDPTSGQTLYNTGSSWSSGYGSWVGNGLAGVPVAYTAVRVAAAYRPSTRLELTGEVEQDVTHTDHRRAALGLNYQIHAKTRLYGRYEWNTGLSTVATSDSVINPITGESTASPYATNAFVFGLESEYMEGGTVFNEYRMYDAMSARQSQWASGLRNQWHVSPNLSLQTSVERLKVLEGDGQASTAATIAAEWRPSELWLLNARLEWRSTDPISTATAVGDIPTASWMNAGYDSWLSTATVARKMNRDWTFLARNYYLVNKYDTNRPDSYEDRFQFGFAYRDTDTNRLNILGRYEYWTRRDQTQANLLPDTLLYPLSDGYDKHIVSVHADWHPNRNWWVSGRLAAKLQTDLYQEERVKFRAYLAGARVTYTFAEKWDASLLGYRMWSPNSSQQYAFGAELGYQLTSNLWLSAGYNARGFSADDMTGSEYTNQGAYLRLRFKFDETLFQGRNPETNRALPR